PVRRLPVVSGFVRRGLLQRRATSVLAEAEVAVQGRDGDPARAAALRELEFPPRSVLAGTDRLRAEAVPDFTVEGFDIEASRDVANERDVRVPVDRIEVETGVVGQAGLEHHVSRGRV